MDEVLGPEAVGIAEEGVAHLFKAGKEVRAVERGDRSAVLRELAEILAKAGAEVEEGGLLRRRR